MSHGAGAEKGATLAQGVGEGEERTVLAVDDRESVLRLIERGLGRAGYRVVTAGDGAEALRLARGERPDIVLLDVEMPGMSGIEVCRQLKADDTLCSIPVLLVTARAQEAERRRGEEAGADGYLVKPFSVRKLVGEVARLLDG